MTPEGLAIRRSAFGPGETLDRLVAAVEKVGMTIFSRIDHAAAAQGFGLSLRPTAVLIFGSPKAGTPLMQAAPTLAIDLPLKALVWQDDSGATWLAYNEPGWLERRHLPATASHPTFAAMAQVLAALAAVATAGADDPRA